MSRPVPTPIVHFTHIDHLATVVEHGLLSDSAASAAGLLGMEVGNREIKDRRRRRQVPVPPGGVVADYAPFYFAPRSPMIFAISRGAVPEYQDGTEALLYLVTTVERLHEAGLVPVFTDRNAVLDITQFATNLATLDGLVDWTLMQATYWYNTPEEPDRRERRMAECLVHQLVPWQAFGSIVTKNEERKAQVESILAGFDATIRVEAQPNWYF